MSGSTIKCLAFHPDNPSIRCDLEYDHFGYDTPDGEWYEHVKGDVFWNDGEESMENRTFIVYYSVRVADEKNKFDYREDIVDLDDVIKAGVKALGLENDFLFVESDMQDSNW